MLSETLLNRSNIPFEVRTTVHSDLISRDDLQAMVTFLQQADYRGAYYIQHYVNGVPVLGTLERSEKNVHLSSLSVDDIQIVVRE